MSPEQDFTRQILASTAWLRGGDEDITCSRISLLLRLKGIDPKTCICAKIFPNTQDPVSGIIITDNKKIYQFGYNLSGMTAQRAEFEEWIDISQTYRNHRWRDEILTALSLPEERTPYGAK